MIINKSIKSFIEENKSLITILLLSCGYFIFYYITDPNRPIGLFDHLIDLNNKYPLGWSGYWDQSQYLRLAHTLASLNFHQLYQTFDYGLGYPMVAVPFIWLGLHSDPFLPFNLFVFVFTAFAVYKAASNLISPLAGWISSFGLIFATPLIRYVDQPWNSTVCLLCVSTVLLVAGSKNIKRWHVLLLGFLVGWSFAARYVDIIWLTALSMAAIYRGSYYKLIKLAPIFLVGLMIWMAPVLYAQDRVFGSPLRTPYVTHIGLGGSGGSDQGINAYSIKRIPNSSLAMLISPPFAGANDTVNRGMLVDMFWVLLAIPGFYIVWRKKNKRLFWAVLLISSIVGFLFYLSFRASNPNALEYGTLHYFKMFWPGLVILSAAFFDHVLKDKISSHHNKQRKDKVMKKNYSK